MGRGYCLPQFAIRGRFALASLRPALLVATLLPPAAIVANAQNSYSATPPAPHHGISASAVPSALAHTAHRNSSPKSTNDPVPPPPENLYSNGPTNGGTNAWAINFGFAVSDNFPVAGPSLLSGMSFAAWVLPGDVLQTVDVSITSAEFGGISYFSETVNFTQSANCSTNDFGFGVCTETANFTVPVFAPGTYWVTLQNAVVNDGDPIMWDENEGPSLASENMVGTIPSESFTMSGSGLALTQTTLIAVPSSPTAGQMVALTASVIWDLGAVHLGTVTFLDGAQVLGTVQATSSGSNTATLNTRFGPGTHNLTAQYNANDTFASSVSSVVMLPVTGTEPTVSTLTATPDGSNYDFNLSVFGFGFPPLTGVSILTNQTQGGMQVGEFNVTGPGTLMLQGPTGFTAGAVPVAFAVGDFNGDGIPDLAVANSGPNTVTVLLGDGHGGFQLQQTIQLAATPTGIATFDFDGDGNLDLAVTAINTKHQGVFEIFPGNGNGTFGNPTNGVSGVQAGAVATGDFDLNGLPDLILAAPSPILPNVGVVLPLLNQGNGMFNGTQLFTAGESAVAVAVGDFNNDGIADVATADATGNQAVVLIGNGDGTFQAAKGFASGTSPSAIAVGYIHSSQNVDMVVANSGDNTITIFHGDGTGNFTAQPAIPVGTNPDAVAIADFNGDGLPDLAVANAGDGTVYVLLQNPDGSFQSPLVYAVSPGTGPNGIIAADLNGDSVPDLAISNSNGSNSVFLGGIVSHGQITNVPVYGQGSQTVQSNFQPDGTVFAGSTATVTVTGSGFQTTTALTSQPNPSTYLQIVAITATVTSPAGGHPTGTVAFADDGNPIPGCTAVMLVSQTNGSAAVCMTSSLAVGSHAMITGTYSGDSNYIGSTAALTPAQVVNQAPTTTVITANPPSPSMFGQTVTFTATVTGANGGSPTGTVTFADGTNPICTGVTLVPQTNGSTATCSTSALALGQHTIGGTYSGDNNFTGGSGAIPYQVNEANTAVSLTVMPSSATAGQVVTLTASVTANTFPVTVGTVTFLSGTRPLGTVQLNMELGTATLLDRFAPGSYTLTAQYNGTNSFAPAVSSPQSLTVTGTEPTISTLTATPDGSNYDFGLSVVGSGFPPLAGSAMLTNITQGGTLLGTINLAGPGAPTFQPGMSYSGGADEIQLAIGDFNGDGIPDLAVTSIQDGTVTILIGNGDGTFRTGQIIQSNSPYGITAFDLNGDGNLDLAVTDGAGVSIFFGNGDGTFQSPVPYQTANVGFISVGDFNRDGLPDLAVVTGNPGTLTLLLNQGNGVFAVQQQTYPAGQAPVGIAVGDFNNDGIPDVATLDTGSGTGSQALVFLGNGDGTFQSPRTFQAGSGDNLALAIAAADFNRDGNLDLAVTNSLDNTVSVLLGEGNGNFQPQQVVNVGAEPGGIAVADFNGDGIPDLDVANLSDGTISILIGNGDGTFQPQVVFPAVQSELALPADLNGDGVPDLASIGGCDCVQILLGGTLSTGTLNNLHVSGTGNQNLQANFAPTGTLYAGSVSNIVTVVASSQIPTTTTLNSSQNPSQLGQPVTFTATVSYSDGHASGVVQFQSNGSSIPECPSPITLTNGVATCTTSSLAAGGDTIIASFSDPTGVYANSSATLTQTVQTGAGDYQISVTPGSLTITQGYSNLTDPFFAQGIHVTVSPLNGYNGVVSLSCSTSPPLTGGSCVVNSPTSGPVDGPLVTTLTITAGTGTQFGQYMIIVSGQDNNGLMHQVGQNLTVIENSSPGLSYPPGGGGTTPVYFPGPSGGMIGNFSCPLVSGTGLTGSQPLGIIGGNCTFNPASGTIPGPIMVTISGCTVASLHRHMPIYATFFFGLPGLVVLGSLGSGRQRGKKLQAIGVLLVISALLLAAGCGGYGQLTPTGHYQVLVQGTGPDGAVYSAVVPVTVTPLN
jgi:Bacterial Ig-like domain (group 3)/FG-GAP-like repeat